MNHLVHHWIHLKLKWGHAQMETHWMHLDETLDDPPPEFICSACFDIDLNSFETIEIPAAMREHFFGTGSWCSSHQEIPKIHCSFHGISANLRCSSDAQSIYWSTGRIQIDSIDGISCTTHLVWKATVEIDLFIEQIRIIRLNWYSSFPREKKVKKMNSSAASHWMSMSSGRDYFLKIFVISACIGSLFSFTKLIHLAEKTFFSSESETLRGRDANKRCERKTRSQMNQPPFLTPHFASLLIDLKDFFDQNSLVMSGCVISRMQLPWRKTILICIAHALDECLFWRADVRKTRVVATERLTMREANREAGSDKADAGTFAGNESAPTREGS